MSNKELFRKRLIVLLVVLVLAALGYVVALNLRFITRVFVVVIGFGALVLIHEFGHFIVAKMSDINVEVFSIGFPPVLAGIKKVQKGWRIRLVPDFFRKKSGETRQEGLDFTIGKREKPGETEYRIGLIPFGGYVKMLGQDDIGPVKSTDDPRSYSNKSAGIRMAVIASGVLFNVIGAVIAFVMVFLIGIEMQPAVIGGVVSGSPAEAAGLRAGDEIIAIDGDSYNLDFTNVVMAAAFSGANEPVSLKVKHYDDGRVEDFEVIARRASEGGLKRFGIISALSLKVAQVYEPDVLFEKTGLRSGDRIKKVNGIDVEHYWQMEKALSGAFAPDAAVVVERKVSESRFELYETRVPLGFTFADSYEARSPFELHHIYSMVPRLRIMSVDEDLAGTDSESSLRSGDIILAVGDVDNPTYDRMRRVIKEYENKELAVRVLRIDDAAERIVDVNVVPRKRDGRVIIGITLSLDMAHPVVAGTVKPDTATEALQIPAGAVVESVDGIEVASFYDIVGQIRKNKGSRITINWRVDDTVAGSAALDVPEDVDLITVQPVPNIPFAPLKRLYKADTLFDAVRMGCKKTWMFIAQTVVTIKSLVRGLVGPKELLGPVGILKLSYSVVASQPPIYYLYLMGLISACIAVFNFLPILPFDGGHFFFLLIEKIKGSAVNERIQQAASRVGWAAVLVLFLYLTFNDIIR